MAGVTHWWVGWNTNQSTGFANPFDPSSANGYQSLKTTAGDGTEDDANAAAALASGSEVSLHNILWKIVGGPYTSQAAANAAIPSIQKAKPAPGAAAQAVPAVSTFDDTAHAASAIYTKLTDGKMWRSLAWILLGVILIFIGLAMLVGRKAMGIASKLPIPLPV